MSHDTPCQPILVTVHGLPSCLVEGANQDYPTCKLDADEREAHNAWLDGLQLLLVGAIEEGYQILSGEDVEYVVNFPADRRTSHDGSQIAVEIVTGWMNPRVMRRGEKDSAVGALTLHPHVFTEKLAEKVATHLLQYSAFTESLQSVLVRLKDDDQRPLWGRWKRETEEPR